MQPNDFMALIFLNNLVYKWSDFIDPKEKAVKKVENCLQRQNCFHLQKKNQEKIIFTQNFFLFSNQWFFFLVHRKKSSFFSRKVFLAIKSNQVAIFVIIYLPILLKSIYCTVFAMKFIYFAGFFMAVVSIMKIAFEIQIFHD